MNKICKWLLACLLLASGVSAWAANPGLIVRLSVPTPVLRGDVDVFVDVAVTNGTRSRISVLKWELPNAPLEQPLFSIQRDGQTVAYTGRLVKRAAPSAGDYVQIEAGATLNYRIELTSTYDLSRSGTYAISYGGALDGAQLKSDAMYLWLEARSGLFPQPASISNRSVASANAVAVPIVFTGNCSASQQTQLTTSVADALAYANNVLAYMNSATYATQRFTKWFGPGTRSSWATIRSNFIKIQDAFANKALELDCSCTLANVYAYVYKPQPYKIYACPVFWTAPATGTDSKAGTMIHEMSHFTVVANTDDNAYGQSAAAALAISNPALALKNADSHEYFAENTPALP